MNPIKIYSLIYIIIFASCTGSKNYNNAQLVAEKKIAIDESDVVLSGYPNSLKLFNDTQLISVVDYKTIVVYGINSGEIQSKFAVDSLFGLSKFNIKYFIENNLIGYYKDRNYITNVESIRDIDMPFLKITNVLSTSNMDSICLIAYIFSPYEKKVIYEKNETAAIWLDYSPVLMNINLNKHEVNSISSIIPDTFNNDSYPNPEFGCMLLGNKLYVRVLPDTKYEHINEVDIYDLKTKKWQMDTTAKYPLEFKSDNWFSRMAFQHNETGELLYNDAFNINFSESASSRKISLKSFFNFRRYERITSFFQLDDDNFIIQTIMKDSTDAFENFYFYNKLKNKMSNSALRVKSKNISNYVSFKADKIIFISKDEEHYYIETYKIVEP